VINDGQQARIRLMLAIEDGAVDMLQYGGAGSDVPVATRHAVNTQAIINAGHSLLLGGLVRDEEVQTTRKVPLLGSLPVIGGLFRSETKSQRKSERMFLISPRLVAYDGEPGGANSPLSQLSPTTQDWVKRTCQGNCVEEYGSQGLQFY
jgi:type III secretion protein C